MDLARSVGIVTDSAADVPPSLLDDLDISVVPLSVAFGEETFFDGELSPEEFFARMKASPALPRTSQPSVGAFTEAYKRLLERYEHVVSVHLSGKLSGTFESAREAASSLGERVRVVDSETLSMAAGFQVLAGARAAAAGESVDRVVEAVNAVRDRVCVIVGFDSLENLAKGGRIGRVAALAGSVLNIRVLLTVTDGLIEPIARVRGTTKALEGTIKWMSERFPTGKGQVAVLHANSPDKAEWLEREVRKRFVATEFHVVQPGPVVSSHTGPGWGLAFVPAHPEDAR